MERVDRAVFSFSHFEMRLSFDEVGMNESRELYRSTHIDGLDDFPTRSVFHHRFLAPCRSQAQSLRSIKTGVSM